MKILRRILASIFLRACNSIYESISHLQSHTKNHFLTYHLRPKFAAEINTNTANQIPPNKLAIIIQGPLLRTNNFTIETIKLYKQIFRGAKLILSTWEDENQETIDEAKTHGVEVIVNKFPNKSGPFNVNYQLKSTMGGLFAAYELGYECSIKTRTDQRLYRHDLFDYFTSLTKAFPLEDGLNQHKRLIVSSFKTCKYRLYSLSDMLMFGDTRDMISYWSADYYEEGINRYLDSQTSQYPPIVHNTPIIAEIYLTLKYLEKLDIEPLWTLQHWWSICRDYFCVVDSRLIDQFSPKYKMLYEYWFVKDYSHSNPRSLEFADWLQLYTASKGQWDQLSGQELYEYKVDQITGWEKYTDSGLYVSFRNGQQ